MKGNRGGAEGFPDGEEPARHGWTGVGRPVRPLDLPPAKVQAPIEDALQVARHKLTEGC